MGLLAQAGDMLARLLPRSLTNRVFAIYGVTLVVFFSGGLALFLAAQYEELVEEKQQSAVMIIELAAQNVRDSAVIGDYDTLRRTLDLAVQGSVFGSAAFIDTSGGRVEAVNHEKPNAHAPDWFIRWLQTKFYDANLTVTVGGKDYGVLRLRFDTAYAAGDLWSLSRLALFGAMVSLVLGLVPIHLLLRRWLGGLDRLRDYELAMAEGRLDEGRLQIKGAPEEIQRVIDMFRRTAELVREREASRRALDNQKFALDQHAIVSITGLSGDITYANNRFCEITGYSREELIGRNHRIINSGLQPREFFENLWATIAAGRVWHGEICNRKRSGDLYWVDATIVPLIGHDGQPEQYIAIRTDITYRKGIETSLQAAKEAAESANRAKSQFLANVSHEIRTPLNAVLGMLKLLQSTSLTPRQGDYVAKTEGAARSLLVLLNDVLDFSKAEANKMTLDPRPFRLDQVLRDLSVILSASVGEKSVEVLFDIDSALPRALVGDDLRLHQVLINLGGNAIKFTESGEVVIRVRVIERSPVDALIEFSVRDTGIGIAKEQQGHIFSGFSQAEASTTRRFGGSGLGLAICDRLIGLMGGKIDVQSEPGRGSEFRFRIRLPLADPTSESSGVLTDPDERREMSRLDVLVVDDNATAREVLANMAESLGWTVEVADSGPLALDMARRRHEQGKPYDVAFVDWQMPGMDGWETSLRLRRHGVDGGGSLVMMVTAHGREMLAHRSPVEQAELGGFLVKPVTASMLFDAVVNARLGESATPAPPASPASSRRLAGLRLLVVEDNPNNQQVAQELLQAEGAVVTLADNGQAGVDAVFAADPCFDAVLMDLQMPVMDGLAAARAIRARASFQSLPIVAMTANAMAADRDACLAAGMTDHIGKPFELADLVRCLLRHTGRAVDAAAVAPPPQASVAADLKPQALELAHKAGIDLVAAVGRLGGNVGVYERMLGSFLRDLPAVLDRLGSAVRSGGFAQAAADLHTLKGLSGMLGQAALQEASARAEKAMRGPIEPDQAQRLLQRVEESAQLLAAVGPALGDALRPEPSAVAKEMLPPDALRASLESLLALLRRSDMGALDRLEHLRPMLSVNLGDRFAALDQATQSLDFDRAVELCGSLLREGA